jgi:hypothetical protein
MDSEPGLSLAQAFYAWELEINQITKSLLKEALR